MSKTTRTDQQIKKKREKDRGLSEYRLWVNIKFIYILLILILLIQPYNTRCCKEYTITCRNNLNYLINCMYNSYKLLNNFLKICGLFKNISKISFQTSQDDLAFMPEIWALE